MTRVAWLSLLLLGLLVGSVAGIGQSSSDEPMPSTIGYPELPHPFWTSADALMTKDKRINERGQHPATVSAIENILETKAEDGCIHVEEIWLEYINLTPYGSVENAQSKADFVVKGTVTGLKSGFSSAGEPGTLVRIEEVQVIHGQSLEQEFFFFVPIGEFSAFGKHICKTDKRFAGLPAIGDEVVLFVAQPLDYNPQFINLRDPGELILIKGDRVLYPRQYFEGPERDPALPPKGRQDLYLLLGIPNVG